MDRDWISSDDCQNQVALVSTLRQVDRVEKWIPSRRSNKKRKRSRSRSPRRYRRHESPDRRRRSYSRDRDVRRARRHYTPDRHRDRRSRSRSRNRGDDKVNRSRKRYSRERDVRRSRSHSHNREDDRLNRSERSYSRDRNVRRSRSHSPNREDDRLNRSWRGYSRDRNVRRSRSRSRNRGDDQPNRSQRSYSRSRDVCRSRSPSQPKNDNIQLDRIAEQLRNIRNKFESNDKASSSSDDDSNSSTEINSTNQQTVAGQQEQERFYGDSAIDILRSKIMSEVISKKSSTVTSAQSDQATQSVWLEHDASNEKYSTESIGFRGVDDNIIKTIVTREISSNRVSNFNMTADMNMQMPFNRPVDQRMQNFYNSQPPIEPGANTNGQIRDPRLQKILSSRAPTQNNSLQFLPYGTMSTSQEVNPPSASQIYNDQCFNQYTNHSSSNALLPLIPANIFTPRFDTSVLESQKYHHRETGNKKSAPMTYGEYRKLQQQSSATSGKKTSTVVKSKRIPRMSCSNKPPLVTAQTMKKPELHENHLADRTYRTAQDFVHTTETATKKAALHDEGEADKALTPKTMPKKLAVRKPQVNVDTTNNDDNTTNENANNSFPQQLLTLVDLMEKMTENNSLVKVKEALAVCTNETKNTKNAAVHKSIDKANVSKKRPKNELDRLHEDIDNMFIRDGVLSANGRRRRHTKAYTEQSIDDDAIESTHQRKFLF